MWPRSRRRRPRHTTTRSWPRTTTWGPSTSPHLWPCQTSSNFLTASVNKFIQVWALGGTAYLNLTTSNGQATVSFNCTLGHPGALHSLPPSVPASPPPRQPRHSGLTELVRNRHHQAARAMASATSPSSVTAPVTPMAMSQTLTASVTVPKPKECKEVFYKYYHCEFESALENGVRIHIEEVHRNGHTETDMEINLDKKMSTDWLRGRLWSSRKGSPGEADN